MKNTLLLIMLQIFIVGCGSSKIPDTLGDPENAQSFGYTPIDPLPVNVEFMSSDGPREMTNTIRPINEVITRSLPDETMRLAISKQDASGNMSFSAAKMGYEGSNYVVILDYIKFDTQSLTVKVNKTGNNKILSITSIPKDLDIEQFKEKDSLSTIPVYLGIGLRITANIKVKKGSVDLGNLYALGAAAEANKITGTLVIQTLGISGKGISPLIPMPSEINTTTIQNSVMALASIKAKIYGSEDVDLNPRIVGFYNSLGGGQKTVHSVIANVLSDRITHAIK